MMNIFSGLKMADSRTKAFQSICNEIDAAIGKYNDLAKELELRRAKCAAARVVAFRSYSKEDIAKLVQVSADFENFKRVASDFLAAGTSGLISTNIDLEKLREVTCDYADVLLESITEKIEKLSAAHDEHCVQSGLPTGGAVSPALTSLENERRQINAMRANAANETLDPAPYANTLRAYLNSPDSSK